MTGQFAYRIDAALIVLGFLLVLVVTGEVGYRIGRAMRTHPGQKSSDLVQQGLLTLLALLLAFGISMGEMRYEERKSLVMKEANSISTTYLRADLFSPEFKRSVDAHLKQYLDARIERYQDIGNDERVRSDERKTLDLQNALWTEAVALGKERPLVTTSLFLSSLNETFDAQAEQEFAFSRRIPRSVVVLLFAVSFCVVGVIGYSNGTSGTRSVVLNTMMSVVLAMTLFVILDLSRVEHGFIRIAPDALYDLKSMLSK